MPGSNAIPAGWMNCPNAGSIMESAKFIAFKTPLAVQYEQGLGRAFRWNPESVFNYMETNNVSIGLWIDLTNTERYYGKGAIEKHGIKYIKMKIVGREVPSNVDVSRFNTHCKRFFERNSNGVIGVHCTHGFNRTGFLICSYLATNAQQNVHDALVDFSKARPPGIYRQAYVAALWEKFPSPSLPLVVPRVHEPAWSHQKNRDRFSRTSCDFPPPSSNSFSLVPRLTQSSLRIPGSTFVSPWHRTPVLRCVRMMCEVSLDVVPPPSYYEEFPGRLEKLMKHEDLACLHSNYAVTVTRHGSVKYLLLIKGYNEVFFIDSALNVIHISGLTFPDGRDPRRMHLKDTLLDGEVILDSFGGRLMPCFFAHDIICLNGNHIGLLPFEQRISVLKKEVIEIRNSCFTRGFIKRRDESRINIRMQNFFSIGETENILKKDSDIHAFTHKISGLRLIPTNENYKPQSYGSAFDWKQGRNVNFRIQINRRKRRADLFVADLGEPFAISKEESMRDGIVGKFSYNPITLQWDFVQEAREDRVSSYQDGVAATSEGDIVSEDQLKQAIRMKGLNSNHGNAKI